MERLKLDKQAGRWAMLGGCILGGGGGGNAWLGEMLLDKLSEAPPLELVPLSEVEEDSVVLSVSLVGAPAAAEQYLDPGQMIRTVELFRENCPDVKLGGVITNENGACATVNGWVQAAFTGLPFLDAQCNGRAHPTGVMGSMNLHKDPGYQTVMTFAGGDPAKGRYVEGIVRGSIDHAAALVRAASVEAGGVVAVARNPVTAAHVKANGAVGGISQSIALGRAVEEGLAKSPLAGVERAVEVLKGRILCQGKVDSSQLRSEGGFDVGIVSVAGYELTCLAYTLNLGACVPGPSEHLQKRTFSRMLYQEIAAHLDQARAGRTAADVFTYLESVVRGIMATWCFSNHAFHMEDTGRTYLACAVQSIFPSIRV